MEKNINTFKDNSQSRVDLIRRGRKLIVKKQYKAGGKDKFWGEINNLILVKSSGFTAFPELLNADPSSLSLEFPYVGDDLEKTIRTHNMNPKIMDSLINNIYSEVEHVKKISEDNLFAKSIDPFFYSKFVASHIEGRHLESLVKEIDRETILFRYDPEACNYLIDHNENVLSIDFGTFRKMHPMYTIAYLLVHLERPEKRIPQQTAEEIKRGLIEKVSRDNTLYPNTSFEIGLSANLVEIYSYILHHSIFEKDEYDPTGENSRWARRKIKDTLREEI